VLAASDLTQGQARTLLGGFLFSSGEADAPVERLSGGERRRLELVALIARGGNLLVLDEPTNHLDTESREALGRPEAFDGTVLIVSHDRALIDAVATHTLALEDGRAVLRHGGYGDLLRARGPPRRPAAGPPRAARAAPPPAAVRDRPGDAAPAREVRRLERRSRPRRGGIAAVEAALADQAVLADHGAVVARGGHRALQQELAWLMREWERVAEAAAG
jgi:ATP-binding cassette subfamily F protein 3